MTIRSVLKYFAGKETKIVQCETVMSLSKDEKDAIVVARTWDCDLAELYRDAQVKAVSVLFVNIEEDVDNVLFDVGEIPVPEEMVLATLRETMGNGLAEKLIAEYRGLTLREVYEVTRMASAREDGLTSRSVRTVKHMMMPPTPGLHKVATELEFSFPRKEIDQFLLRYRKAFELPSTGPLSPRGLLLRGKPGAGKTHVAKILANELGIPLFRATLGGAMDRWHGQSEQNLRQILSMAELEAPCILLMDEVEKEVSIGDDSGVANRMLAQLLWWMAEHKAKVITCMTTNDVDKVPEELYRPGRVNEVIEIGLLDQIEAREWAKRLFKHYKLKATTGALTKLMSKQEAWTPAELQKAIETVARSRL